jgi:ribosomal protein S18 acetylase RimI-like enzyme
MKAERIIVEIMDGTLIAQVSDIHIKAFPGYKNTQLGKGYISRFLRWFRSYEHGLALVAKVDGTPAGYVVGAREGYQKVLNRDLAGFVFLCFTRKPWLLLAPGFWDAIVLRLANLLKGYAEKSSGCVDSESFYSLVGIGVDPSYNRHGVGGELLRAFEEEVFRRGYNSLKLTVYSNNNAAKKFYEKHGWILKNGPDASTLTYSKDLK